MKDAVFTWRGHFFMLVCVRPLCLDRLVGGHKEFHACPCNKICNGADAEDNHITGRLALEGQECEG